MNSPLRYSLVWLVSLVLVLAVVAAFDGAVDPYGVIGTKRIAGFNALKSTANNHTSLIKAYQVERMKPHGVIIGTSRAEIALDPDSPLWPAAARPVYNYGIPGASLKELYRELQDAGAAGPIKVAVIMLEFESFLLPDTRPGLEPDEDQRMLVTADGQPNPLRARRHAQDIFLTTLTLGALEDSIGTVFAQHRQGSLDQTDHGVMTEAAFRMTAATDGYNELFTQKEQDYAGRDAGVARAIGGRSLVGETPGIDTVRQMLAYCRSHGIQPILILPPYHADLLEIFDAAGLWDRFEAWKADLVKLAAQSSTPADPIKLWDFSGYNRYSTEDVPPPGDHHNTVTWFWEPGHFKRALGDLMLSRVLTGEPADFGVELNPNTIDAQIQTIRAARQAYRAAHTTQAARAVAFYSRAAGIP